MIQVCQPEPLQCYVWGEALWLHPTGVDMAHAQQQNGIGGAGTVPFGEIGVVDPDFTLGYRVGGEWRFDPKESVFGDYSWLNTNSSSHVSAPDIPGGGGAVGSLVQHPGAAITASAGPVDANYDVDFKLAEIACRYFLDCSRDGEVSVFGGGRWAELNQDFSQTGLFGGGQAGVIDTSTAIQFDGGGPLIGLAGERLIGQTRFSAYGHTSAAAIEGQFKSRYTMNNATTVTKLAEADWNDDRIVPMLDYELGSRLDLAQRPSPLGCRLHGYALVQHCLHADLSRRRPGQQLRQRPRHGQLRRCRRTCRVSLVRPDRDP